jgi:hypothetical protein
MPPSPARRHHRVEAAGLDQKSPYGTEITNCDAICARMAVPLPIQSLPALHAEAVPPQVVMPARRAHQAPRRIGLQPPLALSPVPDPILGPQHPPPPLPIKDREVAHSNAESPGLQDSGPSFLDQVAIAQLRFGEWIDSHRESIAREALWGRGLPRCRMPTARGPQNASHHHT